MGHTEISTIDYALYCTIFEYQYHTLPITQSDTAGILDLRKE